MSNKILNRNFESSGNIDCDYTRRTNCESSGCDDNICRCSTIEDLKIASVNIVGLSVEIYNEYFDDSLATERDNKINSVIFGTSKEIDIYTIDRVLRYFKLWDYSNWNVEVRSGYYGEELGEITIESSIALKVQNEIE